MTYGQSLTVAVGLTAIAVALFLNHHVYFGSAFVAAALTFVGVAIWLFAQQKKPHDSLPTLDLVVRLAERPYVMDVQRNEDGDEWFKRWFRVGVVSDKAVRLHVLLESCRPVSENVFPAHALQVMGQPHSTEYVDVQPGPDPSVFIDVFTQTIDDRSGIPPDGVNTLRLCYVQQLNSLIPNVPTRIRLKVEGGGAYQCRDFAINFDSRGLATFAPD